MEHFKGVADGIFGLEDKRDHGDMIKEVWDKEDDKHFEAKGSLVGLEATFDGPKRGENREGIGDDSESFDDRSWDHKEWSWEIYIKDFINWISRDYQGFIIVEIGVIRVKWFYLK